MPVASDSSGSQRYWIDGIPYSGLRTTGGLNMQFWNDGIPQFYLFSGLNIFASAAFGGIGVAQALLGNLFTGQTSLLGNSALTLNSFIYCVGVTSFQANGRLISYDTVITYPLHNILFVTQYVSNIIVLSGDICKKLATTEYVTMKSTVTEYTTLQSGIISCRFVGGYTGG
jgi:hypothetical protein